MKNFLLIPDSFKGTIGSADICRVMSEAIRRRLPDARIKEIPVADGGEGSVEAFLASMGGEKRYLRVKGPFFDEVDSFYGILGDGETAVIIE